MKKTILLLIIAAGLASTANAQMYNYMGNHIVLNMEGYFSPSWLNPNPMTPHISTIPEAAQRYLGFNYFLSPSVEFIAWKKGTVGVGYNYFNSPFKGTDARLRKGTVYEGGYVDWRQAELNGNVTAHGFNVYYKHYFGDGFAPLGHHLKFNFDGFFYHYKMDTAGVYLGIINTVQEPFEEIIENKGSIFGLKIEYGYDFIVLNRLKLTLGASLGTTFGGYSVINAKIHHEFSDFDIDEGSKNPIHYDNHARSRILGAYWFGVKLGIGVIPF